MLDQIVIKCPAGLKETFIDWFWNQGEQEFLEASSEVWNPRIEEYVKNPNVVTVSAGKGNVDILIEEEPYES